MAAPSPDPPSSAAGPRGERAATPDSVRPDAASPRTPDSTQTPGATRAAPAGAPSAATAGRSASAATPAQGEPAAETASTPLSLSVFLIARNEESRIAAALESVRGLAAETIVVDSGSTDRTVEIAESLGARVLCKEWTGYGPHKRFAEDHCAHPWRLNLDADEVVSPPLAAEIRALLAADPPPGAYEVWILTVYPGDTRPRPFARDYRVVRLYHRDAGRYRDHPIHDRVVLAPGIAPRRLAHPVWHHPVVSWEQAVEKANRFSSLSAASAGPRSLLAMKARLPFELPYWFIRTWFLRRHVFGGWKGFVFALNQAFMRTMRTAKIIERIERERRG